jgi:sulfoxide reductase heme-binding subunit YedZ
MTSGASQWLWFVSRGSGLVLLVLFSVVVVLGVATRMGAAPLGWKKFTAGELHRTFSLFGIALVILHVATAIADPYVSIGWWATVLPFVSHYRTAALGAGAFAVDLAIAVVVTSLLREKLGYRAWKAVHWLAYLAWPVAFAHALTAGNDLGVAWVAGTIWASGVMVATAVLARVLSLVRRAPGRPPMPLP